MSSRPIASRSWSRVQEGAEPEPAALLESVRQGDMQALQRLIEDHWRPLHAFACRMVGCPDSAEDVVQQAFVRLWERRDRWRPGSDPRLILYTVVRNLALNQIESDRARIRRRHQPLLHRPVVSTPAQILDENELARQLESSIEGLSPRRREALLLARFHHMTHAEIAEVMGLTQRTVTNHITAALAELEVAMSRYLQD